MSKICNFFSCCSDGKGKVIYFKAEDVVKIMVEGNPKGYNFNSHTSICDYFGYKGKAEDKWNKWEYDATKKELKVDKLNTEDDKEKVKEEIEKYLKDKDVSYLANIYGSNSGNSNSGNRNSGYSNSGDRNSGDWNSGYRNSGNSNSGNSNSGNRNSGNSNSGNSNSGNWNSGNWNSGCSNSGDRNSGNRNSGDWNSGNRNSGCLNTNEPPLRIFDKETKVKSIRYPNYFYFELIEWISDGSICGGHLETLDYKEAWRKSWDKASLEDKKLTLKLPNFNNAKFKQITGIDIKKELKEIK